MIRQLEDVFDEFVKPLNDFDGSRSSIGSGLKYKILWSETNLAFTTRLNEVATMLERSKQFKKEEIVSEVSRLQKLFNAKF